MILFDLPPWIAYGYLFVLGAIVGSFLNVCIYRIPQHDRLWPQLTGLWSPPSRCPRCQTKLSWRDNLPIVGWLFLRGRCRYCRMGISSRYPIIELLNGLLFVLLYWMEVPAGWNVSLEDSCLYSALGPVAVAGSWWSSPTGIANCRFLFHLVLVEALLVASMIDFDLKIIPDASTVPAMIVGLIAALLHGKLWLVPVWFQNERLQRDFRVITPKWLHPWIEGPAIPQWIIDWPHLHGLAVSLAGLLFGGGIVWTVRLIGHRVIRREAMGFGDVILMAMIGGFLGWQATVMVFFLAPVMALVVVFLSWLAGVVLRRGEFRFIIPFGPYLSLAAFVLMLTWSRVWPDMSRVFSLGVLLIPLAVIMAVLFTAILVLVQVVKRLFGIDDTERFGQGPVSEWTAADQSHYFAGEQVDTQQGRWRTRQWPGVSSGRGQGGESQWRDR